MPLTLGEGGQSDGGRRGRVKDESAHGDATSEVAHYL